MGSGSDDAMSMSDDDVRARIASLQERLHRLRDEAAGSSDSGRGTEESLQAEIDQWWDLLRQRNARVEAHESTSATSLRPSGEVARYLQ